MNYDHIMIHYGELSTKGNNKRAFIKELGKNIRHALKGYSSLSFIIGSSYGISDEVRAFADYRLSLSEMTFTHPQTLLLILEQVYRAFKINSNETYHK